MGVGQFGGIYKQALKGSYEKDIEAFKKLNARGIELEVRKVSTDPKLKMMDLISKIDK